MPQVKQINHVAVVVDDMDKALNFWQDALGIELHELRDVPAEKSQVALAARIFPLVVPPTAALPAIAYQKVSSPKEQAHPGSSHLCRSRIQFTCVAEDYAGVKALATAVKNCWNPYRGTVSSVRIGGCSIDNDTDSALERQAAVSPVVRIDVLIWHYE